MSMPENTKAEVASDVPQVVPNGPAAAAILSASAGSLLLGILAVAADGSKRLAALLTFYRPTGPLSGVTSVSIVGWLVVWSIVAIRWRTKTLPISKINTLAFALLAIALLLTFPPFGDLLLGK